MFTDVSQVRRQAGVTLVELMIAMFILSIILALGVPSFREATANAAMRGTTMDMVAAINAARAESVSLRVPVNFRPTDNADWSLGWDLQYVFDPVDTSQDRSFTVRDGMQIIETNGLLALQFRPNGTVDNEAEFIICDGRPQETGRRIRLNRLGRMTNEEFQC